MAKKQRISDLEKYTVVGVAALVDASHVLIGAAEIIPVIGIAFVPVDYLISFFSFLGFLGWYVKIGSTVKRMEIRIASNMLISFASMLMSGVPYGGPFFSFILSGLFTIRTYLFIRSIQKEDKEEAVKLLLEVKGVSKNPTKQMVRDYTRYTKSEKVV